MEKEKSVPSKSGYLKKINFLTTGYYSLLIFITVGINLNATGKELNLVNDRNSDYSIAVDPRDIVANTAAKELADHLEKSTGARIPIKKFSEITSHVIAVGPAAAMAINADLDLSFKRLGNDGILLKTSGENLILSGADGAKRGTIYAVYQFLEEQVGVRWWTSSETYIPQHKILKIQDLDISYVPQFIARNTLYLDIIENGIFAARCKCNGRWNRITPEYGGRWELLPSTAHSFYYFLPPHKYFKDHPDWYSYSQKEGKRTCSIGAQLCLSNDEMRKEFTQNCLDNLRRNPKVETLSIAPEDGCNIKNGCDCLKCLAKIQQEGSPSGLLLEFINQIATEIEKEFPNVYVETLAYQYTQEPPRNIKANTNVDISFSTHPISFSKPLSENKECHEKLQAWKKISRHIFFWNYVANYQNFMQPHPNLRTIAPNIRYFADNNGFGVMENGDNGSLCGDFVQLRAWLTSHLLWNPNLDEKILIKEFMTGYYGKAAKPLLEYLDLVNNAGARSDKYTSNISWFTLDDMNQATELFTKALNSVKDDPIISRRVKRAQMPLDFTWLRRYQQLRFKSRIEGKTFNGPSQKDIVKLCNDFIKTTHEFGLRNYTEFIQFKDIEPGFAFRFQAPSPMMCKELPDDAWFDVPNADFGYWGLNSWVKLVDDPKASCQRAARMPGNHNAWATYFTVPSDISELGARVYAVVRCDIKKDAPPNGIAFKAGIQNKDCEKECISVEGGIKSLIDGEYHIFDLGICNMKNCYVWFAPVKNPDVEGVYVDRIFFVKDKTTTNKEQE